MKHRTLSVSAALYDGYPLERMLESLARLGVTHVEPTYVAGYTERFDEHAFDEDKAAEYEAALHRHGIRCHAMSAHMDLSRPDAVEAFKRRMDFAHHLGARVINTFTAKRRRAKQFYANVEQLAHHAEALGMWIGLENAGDGADDLLNVAADAPQMLSRIGSTRVGLNYDVGNTVSHRPEIDAAQDALQALPCCVHMHLKDVRGSADGWFFTSLGQGEVGLGALLRAVAGTDIPVSIDIPMRLHRRPDAKPGRARYRVPLADIETTLQASLRYVRQRLGASRTAHTA
ncbi:sugar phosphate isomerase/epimerase family protein [Azohydromonas australica]|uniref:sugar phosphate isomerase/epimerase family protein n=1 Tax=Azohydromonas australica TaxID=364039 RepID=UPI0004233E84|nr:sugar phosphate isomerase/epimerase [Azohydromonas australica]